ncbi:MAG: M48 family metallopeptidase, partial [Bacteroidota bacterium]
DALPVDFTKPSKSFQQRAWLAVAGLGLFLILYLGLSFWFAYNSVDLFLIASEGRNGAFWTGVIGVLSAFMAVFMFKALFFVIKQDHSQRVEVTAASEPKLFEFIHQIADQSGAPRPHKIYLSPIVNASVFYELSVLNLLWPSKKNLEIGIGLINVLTLGETKAVLAHEFGHFAQRSMLIGRWVYIGQQIAGHIIAKRDALDRFISEISSWDIRIAWIGWVLSIVIWAIRALAETLFTWVIIAQRALSREMEFHADLVAVSLTGSDAIVHALHHLQAADQGFQEALETVSLALQEQKKVDNLYPLQTDAIQRMRHLLSDDDYGRALTVPRENAQEHRVFQSGMAQVPQMWATHPPDYEREANAKQTYIRADIHPESAWELFQDPLQVQVQMTEVLLQQVQLEQEPSLMDEDSAKLLQGKRFGQPFLDPTYKGVYLDRFLAQYYQDPSDCYDPAIVAGTIHQDLAALYPDSIREDLEAWQQLRVEEGSLKGLEAKFLKAPGGVIWHRGEQIQHKQLPEAIAEVEEEQRSAAAQIRRFDQICRSTHLAMAQSLGKGWEAYHQSLVATLHYAEHTWANLEDAWGVLNNVFAIVTADGRVSGAERRRLPSRRALPATRVDRAGRP